MLWFDSTGTMEINNVQRKPVPIWVALLLVAAVTFAAFWFFGGQHYLANKSEIDYSLFHHPEDEANPFSWLGLLVQSGACSAVIGFTLSSAVLITWNWRVARNK